MYNLYKEVPPVDGDLGLASKAALLVGAAYFFALRQSAMIDTINIAIPSMILSISYSVICITSNLQ